jgi:hypothetical protein
MRIPTVAFAPPCFAGGAVPLFLRFINLIIKMQVLLQQMQVLRREEPAKQEQQKNAFTQTKENPKEGGASPLFWSCGGGWGEALSYN